MRNREAYIVHTPIGVTQPFSLATITNKTVGPGPADVLHSATRLGEHDVAEAGVVGRGRAVGYRKIALRGVAGQEDADVVDLAGAVFGVWG